MKHFKRTPRFLIVFIILLFVGQNPLRAAATGYLKIGDIKGESQAVDHEDEIDVFAVSWTIRRSIPEGSIGAQRSRGGTTLGDIVITRHLDKASPKLMEACSNGTVFNDVVLTFQKQNTDAQIDYLKFTLTDVLITSVTTGVSEGDDRLTETLSLNFTSSEIVYNVVGENGSVTGVISGTVSQSAPTP